MSNDCSTVLLSYSNLSAPLSATIAVSFTAILVVAVTLFVDRVICLAEAFMTAADSIDGNDFFSTPRGQFDNAADISCTNNKAVLFGYEPLERSR